jgi:putative transposase
VYDGPIRKRLRYQGHDYHAPCCVHVTICTHGRQQLFGAVSADRVHLNDAGQFAEAALCSFQSNTDGIAIDTHIIMPDHVHAIIVLGTNPHVQTTASISDLVQRFKMRVMKSWRSGVKTRGWAPYDTHLWQRSFYDTLIAHERQLEQTRAYILANPARWIERQ